MIVTYVECERYRKKGYHMEENRGQEVIRNRQKWYRCSKGREKEEAHSRKGKVQQSGAWSGEPEDAAKEGGSQRDIRRTFKMLREV